MNRAEKFLEQDNGVNPDSLSWVTTKPPSDTHEVVMCRLFKDGSKVYGVRPLGNK